MLSKNKHILGTKNSLGSAFQQLLVNELGLMQVCGFAPMRVVTTALELGTLDNITIISIDHRKNLHRIHLFIPFRG